MATVTSYGAAGTVTGSCHLLEIGEKKILIDCGMFQGETQFDNHDPFGFIPADIGHLVLTHGHIDHIGRTPKLVKEGFAGSVIATRATFDIARIMLEDSAKIIQEEYATQFQKAQRRGEEHLVLEPLYDEQHVDLLFELPRVTAKYGIPVPLGDGVTVTFYNAGHILGSAFAVIEYTEATVRRSVLFSGDIGSPCPLIIDGLEQGVKADTLYLESTYGDRDHKPISTSIAEFKEALIRTLEEGGNVLIPSFALERTQEILWLLHEMHGKGELPQCQVFLDSPLAIKATELFRRYPVHLSEDIESDIFSGEDPFSLPWLKLSLTRDESRQINRIKHRAVIIAGSGMCTGGRIMHHLKHRAWDSDNAILFVGYQVKGTPGRKIIDGVAELAIYGEPVKIRSRVYTLGGFSAHADQQGIITWLKGFEEIGQIRLIHGETEKMKLLRDAIAARMNRQADIAAYGETYDL